MRKPKPFVTPAWVAKIMSEARDKGTKTDVVTHNDTVNFYVYPGEFDASNSIGRERRFISVYGKYSVRVHAVEGRENASVVGAQFDDASTGNRTSVAEKLWRDALYVMHAGVQKGRASTVQKNARKLFELVKLPFAFAALASAPDADLRWMLVGPYSTNPYENHLLLSVHAPDIPPFEIGGMHLRRTGERDYLGAIVKVG